MSGPDRAAALRSRRDEQKQTDGTYPAPHQTTGRPADLVITSDMIAAPVRVEASGDLSPDESHQLKVCERAVENLATATWLAGKALHAICNRKLYRHTHTRFDTYVEERWEISARAAYQMIEEWPLAERLTQTMGEPPTASHTRALLPVVRRFGLTAAADLYQQIRARAAVEDRRLTATITGHIVKAVLKTAGWPAEETHFQAAARQLMTAGALPLTTSAPLSPQTPRWLHRLPHHLCEILQVVTRKQRACIPDRRTVPTTLGSIPRAAPRATRP